MLVCVCGLMSTGFEWFGVSLFGSLGLPSPARQGELSRFGLGFEDRFRIANIPAFSSVEAPILFSSQSQDVIVSAVCMHWSDIDGQA